MEVEFHRSEWNFSGYARLLVQPQAQEADYCDGSTIPQPLAKFQFLLILIP